MRRRLWIARSVTIFVGLAIGLALTEVALRAVEKARVKDRALEENLVPDSRLGRKLAPYSVGHDGNGFRNDTIPSRVEIVALGDSQTWGVNVARYDAWPQQLARLSGRSVYNMGLGGYGPVQYLSLIEKAETFSPRVIIVGLYLGNDLYDAYQLVYSNVNYEELRAAAASESVRQDTVAAKAQSYWDEEKNFHNRFGRSSVSGWSFWLRQHSALGRLLNNVGLWPGATDVDYEIDKAWAEAYPTHGAVYDGGANRTVFTTAYRLVGLDLDDPHIAEGMRITNVLLLRMNRLAERNGARLLVLIIPTKESAYLQGLKDKILVDPTFEKLVEMETRARTEIISTCSSNRIAFVDILPPLSAAIARGDQIYPSTTESHPNARGYAILANAAQEGLAHLPR